MQLSIIIPCFNEEKNLGASLDALIKQQWSEDWEIIISDNGSTDDSMAIANAYCAKNPNIHIVDASHKKGGAYARNTAVKHAKGESIVFFDADDLVAPGWVAAIGNALEDFEFVASRFDNQKISSLDIQRYGRIQEEKLQELWYPPYSPHASGCGLGVRRHLHEKIGGFDESMMRLMDTDYCIRMQQNSVVLQFVPDALIFRRWRDNYGDIFKQGNLWGLHNAFLYKKYRPEGVHMPNAWRKYILGWLKLLRQTPRFRSGQGRAILVYRWGWQIGLFQGSLKFKVAPPAT